MDSAPSSSSDGHKNIDGQQKIALIGDTQVDSFNDAVGFRSIGKVVKEELDDCSDDHLLLNSLHPPVEHAHTIQSILGRPILIESLKWSSSHSIGSILGTFVIMELLRTSLPFKIVREKLQGFYGFHAVAHLKCVINPHPFQSGIFHSWYIPLGETFSHFDPNMYTWAPQMTLPFATGCPNIICNIGTQSEVELAIPYTGPNAFINLTNHTSDFGTFRVQVLTPLADSTNASELTIDCYMYFTDVKVFGASPYTWGTQGDDAASTVEAIVQSVANPVAKLVGDVLPKSVTRVVKKAVNEGFSKPNAPQASARVAINPYANITTLDGVDSAIRFAALNTNSVSVTRLGIDDDDELDINKVVGTPNYYTNFEWKKDQAHSDYLLKMPVNPNACIRVSYQYREFVAPSRLRYLANMFRLWRGTIRYTFYVSATKYHSGRLRFIYALGVGNYPRDVAELYHADRLSYGFSKIVDIRGPMTFTIECPYFASTPWRPVPQEWNNDTNMFHDEIMGQFDDEMAFLAVFVEAPLKATENVSSSVNIMVSVSGGPDFMFAAPIAPETLPIKMTKTANLRYVTTHTKRTKETKVWTAKDPFYSPGVSIKQQLRVINRKKQDSSMLLTGNDKDVKDMSTVTIPALRKVISDLNDTLNNEKSTEAQKQAAQKSLDAIGTAEFRMYIQTMVFVPQGDDDVQPINMVTSTANKILNQSKVFLPLTVGEEITNLRALLKRQTVLGGLVLKKTLRLLIAPFATPLPVLKDTQYAQIKDDFHYHDYYGYLSHLYRFYRGGVRWTFTVNKSSAFALVKFKPYIVSTDYDIDTIDTDIKHRPYGHNAPIFAYKSNYADDLLVQRYPAIQPFATQLQGGAQFEVPYYSKSHKCCVEFSHPESVDEFFAPIHYSQAPTGVLEVDIILEDDTKTVTSFASRGVADDFNFGFLLGAPVNIVNSYSDPQTMNKFPFP